MHIYCLIKCFDGVDILVLVLCHLNARSIIPFPVLGLVTFDSLTNVTSLK